MEMASVVWFLGSRRNLWFHFLIFLTNSGLVPLALFFQNQDPIPLLFLNFSWWFWFYFQSTVIAVSYWFLGRLGRFQITSLLGSKTQNIIGSIETREIFLLFQIQIFTKLSQGQ